MNRSRKTEDAYSQRGRQIWNRYAKNIKDPSNLDMGLFIDWLEELLRGLMPATRRLYLASIKAYLKNEEQFSEKNTYLIQEAISGIERIRSSDFGDAASIRAIKRKHRTSRQKAKKIDRDDLRQLLRSAGQIAGQWAKPACIWLMANVLVGLRPCEWRTARVEIVDRKPVLLVKNGKLGEKRSNGPVRTMDLSSMKADDADIVIAQLGIAGKYSKSDDEWFRYFEGCRKTLYKITRSLWPNRRTYPTLYTGRHQFSANAKSAGLAREEIAALLGHASLNTATNHYGKKKWGIGKISVQPSQEDVARVKEREAKRESNKTGF